MIEARSFPCNLRGKNSYRAPFVITVRVYVARIVAPQSLQSNTEVFSVNTHANQNALTTSRIYAQPHEYGTERENPLLAGLLRIRAAVLSPAQGSFATKTSRLHSA